VTGSASNRERALAGHYPPPELAFSEQEYRDRLRRIQQSMQRQQLDLLFLSAPESICYLSGHQASWYQGQAATDWHPGSGIAVKADADDYIHFEDEDELVQARLGSVSPDIRIRLHDEGMPSWAEFIAAELAAAGWLSGTAGLEMWSSRPNRGYSEIFQAVLESRGLAVTDATQLVRKLRNIKSPQELGCIRSAQQIAEAGMRAAIGQLRPGVTELDIAAEISYAMAKAGGEPAGIPTVVVSGPRSLCAHALPSRRTIGPGDLVNIEVCGVYHRYHSSLARSLSVGTPQPGVACYAAKVADGVRLAARTIRPGQPAGELLAVLQDYYQRAGIWADRWWIGGYELGIAFPPDTVGEFYYEYEREPGDKVFDPGVVCNFESNFYLPDSAGLMVSTSTMAFTDDTAEFLNELPPDLIVVE
jgi:Xaa-Pro aminopeptidase